MSFDDISESGECPTKEYISEIQANQIGNTTSIEPNQTPDICQTQMNELSYIPSGVEEDDSTTLIIDDKDYHEELRNWK